MVASYDNKKGGLHLELQNMGKAKLEITITCNAYDHGGPWTFNMAPQSNVKKDWLLAKSGNWYDFSIKTSGETGFAQRLAGRVETGKHSISDPAV